MNSSNLEKRAMQYKPIYATNRVTPAVRVYVSSPTRGYKRCDSIHDTRADFGFPKHSKQLTYELARASTAITIQHPLVLGPARSHTKKKVDYKRNLRHSHIRAAIVRKPPHDAAKDDPFRFGHKDPTSKRSFTSTAQPTNQDQNTSLRVTCTERSSEYVIIISRPMHESTFKFVYDKFEPNPSRDDQVESRPKGKAYVLSSEHGTRGWAGTNTGSVSSKRSLEDDMTDENERNSKQSRSLPPTHIRVKERTSSKSRRELITPNKLHITIKHKGIRLRVLESNLKNAAGGDAMSSQPSYSMRNKWSQLRQIRQSHVHDHHMQNARSTIILSHRSMRKMHAYLLI
ncbi:hypothetical protein BJ508DRAFT_303801 [Ascobolus immersus RN42]|uniref:Uncharacterized protein n=1 Tax=Ascobolus immersus RN42 TaxID=1160509 RepID=A0A3N4IDV0_ASCIM|nr:hypothetical protein BJ508DRAFT_303801 [Ascobolus immersus RN42]